MIKVRVADAQALAARTPAELSMYLRSTGWRLAERTGTLASWVRSAGAEGEFEVLQPLDPGSRGLRRPGGRRCGHAGGRGGSF
jgi:hypothetical protein